MTKIEVTDEMEQRFCDYVNTHEGCSYRAALEAAINPPDVVVTDEMVSAGNSAYHKWFGNGRPCLEVYGHVYRAMRRLEPKIEMRCPTCSGQSEPLNKVEPFKVEPFVVHAVPAPGQPWIGGLHSDRRTTTQASGGGSGSGNCDR